MNKRFFKFISMVVCLTLLFGLTKGVMVANATENTVESVTDQQSFISALEYAKEGDIILIHGEIVLGVDVEAPKEQVIIQRTTANDRLTTYQGVEVNFSNLIFDGMGIKSNYPILTIRGDSSITNCTFRNCGDPENRSSSCIGGAVRVESGEVNFEGCNFIDNNSAAGGHLYIQGDSVVTLKQCTMTGGFAVNNGGAIGTYGTAACYVDSCLITENEAANYGGGIGNRSYVQVSNTKLYNNKSPYGGADIGNAAGATMELQDSLEQLVELFKEDNIIPKGWVCDYDFEEAIYIPDVDPAIENSLLKLNFEYKQPETPDETEPTEPDEPTEEPEQPTTPDESETPDEPGESEPDDTEPTEPGESEPSTDGEQTDDPTEENPSEGGSDAEPDTPQDDTPEEIPPSDDEGTGEPDQQPEESTPSNSTVDNSTTDNSVTDNSNTDNRSTTGDIITDNSSSSSTDNSTSSNHESTTDNSRYSNTTDSNNTSTVNNYYTQPGLQPSNNQPEVQTIVVPVGNTGSGEPIEQTITIQSSPEGNGSGSLEGMTLNVNVNIGSENAADQQEALSPSTVQQSGASWYQVAVLCLLSAILVCVIRRR